MRRRRLQALLATTAAIPLLAYLSVVGYFMYREPSLVYAPSHRMRPVDATLTNAAAKIAVTSGDGVKLDGEIVHATSPSAQWIYLLPSNAGNVTSHQQYWQLFHEVGTNMFAVDYRGYGESQGKPSEAGLYRDALAGYDYLLHEEHVRPSAIVLYGYSLGSAVAIDLATKVPVAGVVVEGAPTSLPAVGQAMYPFLPVALIARNRFDSLSKVQAITCPMLFLHARRDHMIPFHHGADLYAAARGPKELVELDGDHGTALKTSHALVVASLSRFLKRLPADTEAAGLHPAALPAAR